MVLSRYVFKTTGLAMLGVVFFFQLLQLTFNFIGETGRLEGMYTLIKAVQFVLWEIPEQLYENAVVAILIGAVVGMAVMAASSELTVMRAAGVSVWRILLWVLRPALLIMLVILAIGEWVLPYSHDKAASIKHADGYVAPVRAVDGYWLKKGNRFIYLDKVDEQGHIQHIQSLNLTDNYALQSRYESATGQFISDTRWRFAPGQLLHYLDDGQVTQTAQAPILDFGLNPQYVYILSKTPAEVGLTTLLRYRHFLSNQGAVARDFEVAVWKKLVLPLNLMIAIVLACCFVFGGHRQQSIGAKIILALFVGLGLHYFQDVLVYLSLIVSAPVVAIMLVPNLLVFTVGVAWIYRVR